MRRIVQMTPRDASRKSGMIVNYIIAWVILGIMFLILFFSSLNDSATFDEIAHIGAGYTYLRYKDSRLNPEHPPLIKDLAALPLIFLSASGRINFDVTSEPFWNADDVHSRQWEAGRILLYESGNDPDQILFFSRLPVILLAILFGYLLYRWVRSIYGGSVALLVLFLYAFSPTFLAHSRYVTTDLAAAFGFFIGIASFTRFLEKQTRRRLIISGISLGIALLFKFSLFLLIPIYGVLALLWVFLCWREESDRGFFKLFASLLGKIALIGLIALGIIYVVYLYHVWNYPSEQEYEDAVFVMQNFGRRHWAQFDFRLLSNKLTRPLGQYGLGLLMVIQRAIGGNTTYYWGEVSASGWPSYFPVAYLLKETIAFHLLSLFALFIALRKIIRAKEKSLNAVLGWTRDNFVLTASIIFVVFYWAYSIKSTLNIGVRHVLPTFPFIYLLVSRELARWLYRPSIENPKSIGEWLYSLYENFLAPIPKIILTALLLFFMILSVGLAFPFYLSYYNELVGMADGHFYIADSNYDWGQDLKRLRDLIRDEPTLAGEKIYLDYFGGGSPRYYLGNQYEPWWSAKGPPPSGSYFAISLTVLRGSQGKPVKGIIIKPEDSYPWLRSLEPITRAGTSIFIYRIP